MNAQTRRALNVALATGAAEHLEIARRYIDADRTDLDRAEDDLTFVRTGSGRNAFKVLCLQPRRCSLCAEKILRGGTIVVVAMKIQLCPSCARPCLERAA